jgi:hypothetical protein
MAITVKLLIPAKTAEASQTTQYTAAGMTALIDKFTATNYSAVAATLSVNLSEGLKGIDRQAAAGGGIGIGQLYRNGSVVQIRVV